MSNTIKKTGGIIIEGHIQGLSNVRSLGEKGIPVIVIDKNNCIARYSKYCKKFFLCPDYKKNEFITFLFELADKENLKGWVLLPSNDHAVYSLAQNRDKILKVFKSVVPTYDEYLRIYDKFAFIKFAATYLIPVPKTFIKSEIDKAESLPYPVLIKGREGLTFYKCTGKKAFIANNSIEFEKIIQSLLPQVSAEKILIQEVIEYDDSADVWSFTCFSIEGKIKSIWIGKKLREHPEKFGTATYAMSDYNPLIEKLGYQLVQLLRYTGVCEIEFIFDKRDNKFKLIEMNARTWLWVGLAKYCGVDYAAMIYNYLNNLPYEYKTDYYKNVNWINYYTDYIFSLGSIIRGKLTLKKYLLSLRAKKVNAVYSKDDLIPGIIFPALFLYIAYKRSY